MLPWIIGVILVSVGMMVGIQLLMNRLGIKPAEPEERSHGFRDVVERVNKWSGERRTPR